MNTRNRRRKTTHHEARSEHNDRQGRFGREPGPLPRSRVHDLSLLLAMATAYHWTPFMAWTGIGLIALGLAVQTWSKGVLTRNRKLMDCGPYSICRHPFYLGNAIFDLGVCTMSGNLWLVAAYPVIFAIGYRFTFRMEETLLHSIHGQAHDEFRATTPMILPNPAGFVRRWRAPFSWRALLVERQVSRSIRLLSFPLLVLVSARAWQQPASLLSSATWTLLAVALALHTMRRFVYTQFEKRQTAVRSDARTPVWSHLALPAAAILPPLLVLFLEHDADDVVLMGLFSAALVGFRLVVEGSQVARGTQRLSVRALHGVAESGIVAGGLWLNGLTWLAPLFTVLLLADAMRVHGHRPAPLAGVAWRRIAGLSTLAASTACIVLAAPRPAADVNALRRAAAKQGEVTVLRDRDFDAYKGQSWISEILDPEDLTIALESPHRTKTLVLADVDDIRRLPDQTVKRLKLELSVHAWFDEYQLLRVIPDTGQTDN